LSSQAPVGPELAAELEREDLHHACVPPIAGRRRNVEEARSTEKEGSRVAPGGRKEPQGRCPRVCGRRRDALGETVCDVTLVAGERLVATITGERHGDMAPRLLGDQEGRKRGFVAERLVAGCSKA